MKSRTCAATSLLGAFAVSYNDRANYTAFLIIFLKLFIVQYTVIVLYNIFIYPLYRSPLRHLPGPKDGHFLLGQTLNFMQASSGHSMPLRMMREHPDAPLIRYMHAGNSEWVLLNSVQACKEMLQSKCYQFEKPEFFRRVVGEIAGIGLVNIEGAEHKRQRRLLNGPLSVANIRKIVPVFNEKAKELAESVEDRIVKEPGQSLEVGEMFSKTLLDIIGRASLGVDLGSLSAQGSPFSDLYSQIFEQSPVGQVIFLINIFIPVRSWLPLKANTDFLHATSEIRRRLRNTIKQRRVEIFGSEKEQSKTRHEFTEEGSRDLLTFMIYERSEGENKWSDEDILGHLLNFMSAGHETTAGALVWATLTLCLHPSIQSRLRAEIASQIPHSTSPSFAELENLTYMSAFLKEVLRCFSPTVMITRTPIQETTLCGTIIPVGTTCFMDPQSIQFNPTVWGPDAESFNPERHLPGHSSEKEFPDSRDPYAMEAFSNGPRICIGKAFASAEFKSVLVGLLRKFEMVRGWDESGRKLEVGEECGPDEEGLEGIFAGVKLRNFMTLRWEGGVYVRFRPLNG